MLSLSGIEVLHDEKARESNKMRFFEDFCEQSVDAGLDQFIYIWMIYLSVIACL